MTLWRLVARHYGTANPSPLSPDPKPLTLDPYPLTPDPLQLPFLLLLFFAPFAPSASLR